jgi:hypothetical protein
MPNIKEHLLIGRKEDIDLPDLKLKAIDAKVDTGAYSSSIHCHQIKEVVRDGVKVLKFKVLDPEHENYNKKTFVFKKYKLTKVKSSNGKAEKRFVIKTKVKIYKKNFLTEFTLTDRSDMRFPVLLGRKFIKQGFLVDVSRYDIASKGKKYKLEPIRK